MTDWTAGYVADIGYTYGCYQELNPLRLKLAFLNAGLVPPAVGAACELGFGQGLSANIHAAASVTHWHGTDFNPEQASFAQELARASGASAHLCDDAFAEFAARADLPDFDYIGLHGIWSWISDANRRVIVDFIRRKLKVGGVLYISYNTLPGWAAFAPMRHLMAQHANVIGADGHGIVSRINGSLDFVGRLLATNPMYAQANPQVAERLKKLMSDNRHYLAHEYFNRDWHPMHFATMVEWLEPAKLSFACSAHYLDFIDVVNLTADQQVFLRDIPDAMLRESVRDFMVNQQFRRDYWVKGARKLSSLEQAEALRAQRILLVSHRPDVSLSVNGVLGEATMSEAIYGPLLDILADHKPKTLGQLEAALKEKGVGFAHIQQAVMVLVGGGHLMAVEGDVQAAKAKKQCDKLNASLMQKARGSGDIGFLASPVTGGGVPVGRFEQLFLLAIAEGKRQPADWAQFVLQILAAQGQAIVKDGKALSSVEAHLAELVAQANEFAAKRFAIMKALDIV